MQTVDYYRLLKCVIHPTSPGSGTERPAPNDEQGRSLEKMSSD